MCEIFCCWCLLWKGDHCFEPTREAPHLSPFCRSCSKLSPEEALGMIQDPDLAGRVRRLEREARASSISASGRALRLREARVLGLRALARK